MAASDRRDVASPRPLPSPHTQEQPDMTQPLDVLIVGDGNFSFSLAFLRKHGGRVRLVATSFDSFEELILKYPESARICAQLTALGATVLHRVDATNLQVSLRNAVVSDENEDSDRLPEPVHERFFDRIIFNHPHCGEENVRRHQSLLSHFYVAAQRVLRRPSGHIHVTLAEGQPLRWEAATRAVKAGLAIVHEIHDVDAHDEFAVRYDRKRHQNGKSFHRVVLHGEHKQQASTLFVLAVAAMAADARTITETISSRDGEREGLECLDDVSTMTRKRKLPDVVSTPASARETGKSLFVCAPCAKSFKTAQGLKTHVHMVHELRVAGEAPSAKPLLLPCGQQGCTRTFRNDEARRQHQVSKHGEDGSIRPDWFRPLAPDSAGAKTSQLESSLTGETTTQGKPCSICGLVFADDASFNEHWQELQPKTVRRRLCSLCNKSFEEERALRQHQNFCRVKAVERKGSVGASR